MNRILRYVCLLWLGLAAPLAAGPGWLAAPSAGQAPPLPEVDGRMPSPADFLGYPLGARFTRHDLLLEYLAALAQRAPERMQIVDYGVTPEGRPLRLVVFASPKNSARLADLRRRWQRIAAGDLETARDDLPAAVWLTYGIHGNESSSAEAAAALAYLLAAGGEEVAGLLERLVVVMDPLGNPDGRERYLSAYLERRGTEANADPRAAEHTEPWPGGRENHYLFDLNRDWAWATQAETRARLRAYREWEPQVHVDFHEMRADLATYFFPPAAEPVNPRIGRTVLPWLATFGRENGLTFDRAGWPFYVRETYDLFYPSYGDSYPSLRGAVGMTYEVVGGGAAGESVRLADGALVTLADRVARHLASSLSTLRTAAAHRAELLESTLARARETRAAPVQTYLWPRHGEGRELAALLELHGVEVAELATAQEIEVRRGRDGAPGRQSFPAGTLVASTAQPLGNLLRTLLDAETSMPEPFVRAQRERLEQNRSTQFYDITAWALPLAYDCDVATVDGALDSLRPVTADPGGATGEGALGFLVAPQGMNGWALTVDLLRRNASLRVALEPFADQGRSYPAGTLIVAAQGADGRATEVADLARRHGVRAERAASSATERGISLGSESSQGLRLPRIGLLRGEFVESTGFGALWHLFDAQLALPHSVIDAKSLAGADLRDLDVLVLPDGDYGELGAKADEALRRWVQSGGVLVGIGGAARWATRLELSKVKLWQPPKPSDDADLPAPRTVADREIEIPGAALRTELRSGSPLAAGLGHGPPVLFQGDEVLLPTGDPQVDVWTVADRSEVLAGLVWPEAAERLRGALLLSSESQGRGQVILFAQDPAFRGFWRGSVPLLLNAVILEPNRHGLAARR